jgi:hypothetical protein
VTPSPEELSITPGGRHDIGCFAWRARRTDGTLLADVVARFALRPGQGPQVDMPQVGMPQVDVPQVDGPQSPP